MNLDDEELKATKRTNGTDTKIVLDLKEINQKIRENEEWLDTKKTELDTEQYNYLKGKLSVLNAIKEGDLSKI